MATTLPRWASRARAAEMEARGDLVGAARMLGKSTKGVPQGRIRGVSAAQSLASRIAARGGDPDAVFQAAEDAEQQQVNNRAAGREEAYRAKRRGQTQSSGDATDKASEAYHIARGSSPEWAREYASAERLKRKNEAATASRKAPAMEATGSGNKGDADAFAGVEAESTPSRRVTATGKASGQRERYVVDQGKKVPWEWWRMRARNQ